MRQAIMTSPGEIEFRDAPVPKPGPTEVLIRVKCIGVCGSDVHVRHGRHPFTSYPVVQGHEFSGVVEAVGKRVRNIKPGLKVTATPQIVCGRCGPCRRGDYHICDVLKVQGFQAPGCARAMGATGTLMYQRKDFIKAVRLIQDKRVLTRPLETTHFPFEAYRSAYDYIDREGERSMKVFVDL